MVKPKARKPEQQIGKAGTSRDMSMRGSPGMMKMPKGMPPKGMRHGK